MASSAVKFLALKTHSTSTSEFFRRIAVKGWDKSAYFTYSSSYPILRGWLAEKLTAREQRILSIGCGSGELERFLQGQGRQVVCLDLVHEMLRSARRRGLFNLVQADARYLPFASSAFDVVIFQESIGYVELQQVLRETARVLKKRGRVLITTYPPHFASDPAYDRKPLSELSLELERSGFQIREKLPLSVTRRRVTSVHEERCVLLFALAAKEQPAA